MKSTVSRVAVLFAAVAATVLGAIPAASAAPAPDQPTMQLSATTADPEGVRFVPGKGQAVPPKITGWDVPNARQYYLEASCNQWAGEIRQGAAAWNQLSEGGGTPVGCQTSYITDCGGTGAIIGCNYGAGGRITLVPTATGQVALLAAHEFGHDWYGHSGDGCANWNSPADVMRTTICG
ncbi:hypothetical protein AB0P21_02390 [Kribbella sp. NPDC056861]|uniref:hypothetical protein n=1 Tax=Kribbella sp. NPDC056861 TaxID=3154857 RepID=UPI00342359E3